MNFDVAGAQPVVSDQAWNDYMLDTKQLPETVKASDASWDYGSAYPIDIDEAPSHPYGDPVVRPNYYDRFEIEPIYFIMRNNLEFWQGSVIKYVLRFDAKNGLEDLKKARRYLDMQIKRMEGDETGFAD